jgi:hypothetical protein
MTYSEIVKAGVILPRKSLYTLKDVHQVMSEAQESGWAYGQTLAQAAYVVTCSAVHHNSDWSKTVNSCRTRLDVLLNFTTRRPTCSVGGE